MTRTEILQELKLRQIRRVSDFTAIVEYTHGGCRPATDLEKKMYTILMRMTSE